MASSPDVGSLKATLGYGNSAGSALRVKATVLPSQPLSRVDLDETIDAASASAAVPSSAAPSSNPGTTVARTTVLPRRTQKAAGQAELRPRFDRVRALGQGGMGEVELVRDNDIRRTVAVKRLRADVQGEDALHRFADEVRIVGQLEHPAIVPVYDVGRDESGQVYLVMKHLNGETMEDIIDKLLARDPAYVERFTMEYRVHLFFGVIDAIRYAHARGVIHRDLKPANVMIGPYGEVTVLDWGIAKTIKKGGASADVAQPLERTLVESQDRLGDDTQFGSLAGTPLYMSPEQAAGRNDELDERSDVYALSVLLFEWLSLMHPLQGKPKTVTEVLAAVISHDYTASEFHIEMPDAIPAEYVHVALRGLVRDREKRIQSVAALEQELRNVMEGHIRISCHITLTKRVMHEFVRWVDRHPGTYSLLLLGFVLLLVTSLGLAGYQAIKGF